MGSSVALRLVAHTLCPSRRRFPERAFFACGGGTHEWKGRRLWFHAASCACGPSMAASTACAASRAAAEHASDLAVATSRQRPPARRITSRLAASAASRAQVCAASSHTSSQPTQSASSARSSACVVPWPAISAQQSGSTDRPHSRRAAARRSSASVALAVRRSVRRGTPPAAASSASAAPPWRGEDAISTSACSSAARRPASVAVSPSRRVTTPTPPLRSTSSADPEHGAASRCRSAPAARSASAALPGELPASAWIAISSAAMQPNSVRGTGPRRSSSQSSASPSAVDGLAAARCGGHAWMRSSTDAKGVAQSPA
mmetsp:Transcript_22308/g.58129  ORF Transcript_22308/g.58129 Transcript_22308/m.58129 type:complete len:317 (-) Transcript_22308:397-1347(-)